VDSVNQPGICLDKSGLVHTDQIVAAIAGRTQNQIM
jgi:hypothetical protein